MTAAAAPPIPVTPAEIEWLQAYVRAHHELGRPPLYPEVAAEWRRSESRAYHCAARLREKGYVVRDLKTGELHCTGAALAIPAVRYCGVPLPLPTDPTATDTRQFRREPSPLQLRALAAIAASWRLKERGPTYRELQDLGIASIRHHLAQLHQRGLIHRGPPGVRHAIRLTAAGEEALSRG